MRGSTDPNPRVLAVLLVLVLVAFAAVDSRFIDIGAHAAPAPLVPNDSGRATDYAAWMQLQWNFVGPYGVDAPHAWGNVAAAGAAGGAGVTVAVLDTGVAYPTAS